MSRSVTYWVGKTDDAMPSPRVRLRIFDGCGHRCHKCSSTIHPGKKWSLDHIIALINGGKNEENNLGPICNNCLPAKNAADVAEKSKTYRIRSKHLDIKKSSRPLPGSRRSPFKKKLDGTTVRR